MPTNLNALIRYKQIDTCLRNRFVRCTIEKLQEVCTDAMGEFRGIYKQVSERTIRDDIRVMRSNMLGFNAPIEYNDGAFYYTDKNYSIFSTPLTEIDLLRDIFKMLLSERNNIADDEVDKLLKRISIIVGEPLPFEGEGISYMLPPTEWENNILPEEDDSLHISYNIDISEFKEEQEEKVVKSDLTSKIRHSSFSRKLSQEVVVLWEDILKVI